MTTEIKEIKLHELCRVCLTKTDNMRQLLNHCGEVSDLVGKLSSIIKSEIDITDNKTHPNYICSLCEEKLILSYEFQQLGLKSHQIILEYSNTTSLDIELKPSYFGLVKYNPDEVKEEVQATVEEISVIYENFDNDNSSDEDYVAEKEKEKPKHKKNSGKSKTTKKVIICDDDEVANFIKEVKMKFYTSRNCMFCGFTASNVRTLSVHMSRLHGNYKDRWCWKCNKIQQNLPEHAEIHKDDFKCPFCGKQSTTSSHFVEHLTRHTDKRKRLCQYCKTYFISIRHLNAHCRKAHKKQMFHCETCSDSFTDKKLLTEHIKIHKILKCNLCEEQFTRDNYNTHICFKKNDAIFEENNDFKKDNIENTNAENVNRQENIYKKSDARLHRYCELCKRKVRNLMNHVNKHHNKDNKKDEPRALCTYCGKQFKHQSNLDVHMRTHTKETPYKCSYCEMSVATRTRLVDHERTHTGEKPFICRFCGKAFKQHGVLNTHLKLHTGRTEQCLLCPKKFCRPSELRNHMRVHTGEKPFACTYCGKCFIQRSHLVEHTKIHTDHRPFKCHICGKAFKQSSTLKGHLNVHEGKKMFKCTVCTYSCRKSYTLKQHLLQHQNANSEQCFFCETCKENFSTLELLTAHKNSFHNSMGMEAIITVDLKF